MLLNLRLLVLAALTAVGLTAVTAPAAQAQDPFIGEIKFFGGNFAPRGWALCDGQLLSISANTALFSILGTTYGGDGRTTFGLPGMRGRSPVHPGTGPGLSTVGLGEKGGTETNTLGANNMPSHTHQLFGTTANGNANNPAGAVQAVDGADFVYNNSAAADNPMSAAAIGNTGGGQSFTNRSPFIGVNCIIALVGVFPSRN